MKNILDMSNIRLTKRFLWIEHQLLIRAYTEHCNESRFNQNKLEKRIKTLEDILITKIK
jgi:CRISPR/Cas system CSM-associated protein Csm4 (group 5 of RAMP superfamily)